MSCDVSDATRSAAALETGGASSITIAAVLASAVALQPADVSLRYRHSNALLKAAREHTESRQHERAAHALSIAMRAGRAWPQAGTAALERSDALRALGRVAEAVQDARAAVTLQPMHGESHLSLGLLLEQHAHERSAAALDAQSLTAEHEAEAHRAYRAAIRLQPQSPEAYYHLANSLRARAATSTAEVTGLLEAARRLEPTRSSTLSSLGYLLLSSASAAERRRGLQVLEGGVVSGVWPTGRWQHPAEYISMVPPPPRSGVHPRAAFDCLLRPLERAASRMGREATAALGRFSVQTEGLAHPAGGWRELNVWRLCGFKAGGRPLTNLPPPPPPGLEATCAALRDAIASSKAMIHSAMFSALSPGTRLSPHCGPTNGRLVMHVGLSVPQPGAAHLRLGRPSTLDDDDASSRVLRHSGLELATTGPAYHEVAWQEEKGFVWEDSTCHEVRWAEASEGSGRGAAAKRSRLPQTPMPMPPQRREEDATLSLDEAAGGSTKGSFADSDGDGFALSAPRIILILLFFHPTMTSTPVCS